MPEPFLSSSRRRTADYSQVLTQLEAICGTLPIGARLPTHTSLMRQLGASERTVLRALEELHRIGRVIRRNGAGTFVAQPQEADAGASPFERPPCIVAIAEPDSRFFDRCVAELFHCADAQGISLVCRPLGPGGEWPQSPTLPHSPASGYLVFGYSHLSLAEQLRRDGQRVVVLGVSPDEGAPEVPCVYCDPEHGGYLAVRHLLELGHRRVAICGGPDLLRTPRGRGGLRAVEERSGSRRAELVVLRPDQVGHWANGPGAVAEYFRHSTAPSAVVASDDGEAMRILATLARAGIRVPEEVSVVGSDAHPEGERVFPSLTTIEPGWRQQLQAALRLLTSPVPPPSSHTTVVIPSLLCRESTGAPTT